VANVQAGQPAVDLVWRAKVWCVVALSALGVASSLDMPGFICWRRCVPLRPGKLYAVAKT
jgi:hypothetical protein